jgi:hypothetical protein
MKSYVNITVVAAVLVGAASGYINLWYLFLGPLAVLAAAIIGHKYRGEVPYLRNNPIRPIVPIVLGAVLIALGALVHAALVWAIGLTIILYLPFAALAHDTLE